MSDPDPGRDLLDLTQDKIAVVSEEGIYRFLNAAAEDILRITPEALVGENVFEYVHPADREEIRERFRSVVTASEPATVSGTYRHRTGDGSWVWLESRLSNERTADLDGYVVSSRDVTDRTQAENRLAELAAKSPDVHWVYSADWDDLLFVNDAVEPIFGIDRTHLERRPTAFLDCVHPEDVSRVETAMERASAGKSINLEYRVNADEDYRRWVWVQAEPVFDEGEVVRIVGFARDVTRRYRRRRQLTVMDNLLRHNIRNSMNAITGNADLIARGAEDPVAERAETITRVAMDLIDSAQKQRRVIELLGNPRPPTDVDVALEARRAADLVGSTHPQADIRTDLPESATARTLPGIGQAIQELLTNAVEHAEDGAPTVHLSVATDDATVTVEIADDNRPIPEYEFLVMTDEVAMNSVEHPSGMGLWLVYWVIEMSDGDLSIDSGGDGNVVCLELPRDTSPESERRRVDRPQPRR